MSSEQDRVRELAERVARRLADSARGESSTSPSEGGEMGALRESLSEIQRRLARIESRMTNGGPPQEPTQQRREGASQQQQQQPAPHTTPTRSMWLSGTYVPATSHPSQEQFTGIGEAVSELVEFFEREKTCTVEPGGKPCDHCGMCSARGF
ncbi:MAG TPA: hypothetical protein VM914_01965 [Pyrinomonadaceae bacterium]|jgi:hypothetical protein|nr:hypothetical protein [Pyrinomonadaceae bacterium]